MGFNAINNEDNMSVLDIFKRTNATHQEIQAAGEQLLLFFFNLPSPLFKCDPCWLVKDCAMERRKRTSQGCLEQ